MKIIDEVENTTDHFPSELFQEFAGRIDRIMGAAKTISMTAPDHEGLKRIGKLSELCKAVGYKASEQKAIELLPIFAAFLNDTIEIIHELMAAIEDEQKSSQIAGNFSGVLQKRLEWLSSRITGSGTAPGSAKASEAELKALAKRLGLST